MINNKKSIRVTVFVTRALLEGSVWRNIVPIYD